MLLIYLSGAWVAGIWLGSHYDLPPATIAIGLIPLPLIFFIRQHKKAVMLSSLCLISLFAAATYSYSSLHKVDENSLHFHNDRGTVQIRGMVAEDPEVRDRNTHLKLSATAIKLTGEWQAVEGTALLFVPRYPAYQYGDVLLVTGIPETPPRFDDFDYQGYLAHQGIYTTMLYPDIEREERGKGFKPLAWIYAVRNQMAQTLAKALPEPQASLAQGIILGMRGNIPASLKADFAHTGTAHLLAISGLHLSIIAGIVLSAGIWLLGRRHYLYVWLALCTIWLYALLTGMHLPVVRGAIMASLFLIAELLGRQRHAITALVLAAALMVGISPYILGDAAFQLSFLAMAGLISLFPVLQGWSRKAVSATIGAEGTIVSIAHFASDSFSVTLAAIIAVWPVVAYYFGIVSLVGPLATFLALPALPVIILAGALTGILGFIALSAAQVAGWLAWLFLLYIIAIVRSLAAPSLSSIEVGSIHPTFIAGYYAVLAAALWYYRRRGKPSNSLSQAVIHARSAVSTTADFISRLPLKWGIPPLLVIAILVSFTAAAMPDDDLHVSFLNVGEGDAILIQQGHQQVLVDGGPSPQALDLALGERMPFWDRTIELVVLTHPHHDHLAGLVEVLQRYRVKQVLYPKLDHDSPLYDEWQRLLETKKIACTFAQAGQKIDLGAGTFINVLNPQPTLFTNTQSDVDNNGVVMRLGSGDVSFLLTADIMQEAEWELITRRVGLDSTVLKIAHHGSDTSSTPEFLAVVNPLTAVISNGADNKFGHPDAGVMERLEARLDPEKIFRIDEQGTVEFITDGERLWVETGR